MNIKKLLHPVQTIKEWNLERTNKLHKEEYDRGYDFAAGILLRGEETPNSLMGKYGNSDSWDLFDEGANDATNHLIREGVIENDRV